VSGAKLGRHHGMSLENNPQASQHVTEGAFDASETLPGNFRYKKLDRSSAPAPRNFTLLYFSFLFFSVLKD